MIAYLELSVISPFNRSQHRSPAYGPSATAVARNHASARLRGRRKQALAPIAAGTIAGYRFWCFGVFLSGALLTMLLSEPRAGDELALPAPRSSRATTVESFATFMAEASRRFAIPAQWIPGVMQLESSGKGRAISPKGALVLMQIMPGTWAELSVRYGLGIDRFDLHDNIMAGAGYLATDIRFAFEMLQHDHDVQTLGFATEGFSLTRQKFADECDINVLMAYGRCLRPALYSSLRSSPSHPTGVSALRVTIAIANARFARKQWGASQNSRRLFRNESATSRRVRAGAIG